MSINENYSLSDQLKTVSLSDHDSEYEDIEDEIDDTSISKVIKDDNDDLDICIKPRRLNKKRENDEHSEGDNDNQNVPKTTTRNIKPKELIDDDNNTQSPAYIPRKGKFYEHDDRTIDEYNRSKDNISKTSNRFYKDSDGKWQHDLYLKDEQKTKNSYRERFYSNNYLSRSQKGYDNQYYYQYHRPIPSNNRINNFDSKHSMMYDKIQPSSRQQRHGNNRFEIDERTFHRQKQQEKSFNRIENENQNLKKYNLPPRLQINNNNRNLIQKQQYQQNPMSTIERSKRYSNMRNNMTNSIQQQSQMKHYQDQRSNNIEQNDWPQAPPPPTSYLPQQLITPQMFYQQQQTSRYVSLTQQIQENK